MAQNNIDNFVSLINFILDKNKLSRPQLVHFVKKKADEMQNIDQLSNAEYSSLSQELIFSSTIDKELLQIITCKSSPLMVAILVGNSDMIELLLQNGANIEYKDKYNRSILSYLSKNTDIELIKSLILDYKIQDDSVSKYGTDSLLEAYDKDNLEVFSILISSLSKEYKEQRLKTFVMVGDLGLVSTSLRCTSDNKDLQNKICDIATAYDDSLEKNLRLINIQYRTPETSDIVVNDRIKNFLELIKSIRGNKDIDSIITKIKSDEGFTYGATQEDIYQYLTQDLEDSTDPVLLNDVARCLSYRYHPMIVAVECSDTDTISKLFSELGMKMECVSNFNHPITIACNNEDLSVIEKIYEHDKQYILDHAISSLDIVVKNECYEITNYFLSNSDIVSRVLQEDRDFIYGIIQKFAEEDKVDFIKKIMRADNLFEQDFVIDIFLTAISEGSIEVAEYLFNDIIDINNLGIKPFMVAIENNRINSLDFLCQDYVKHINIDEVDQNNMSALLFATYKNDVQMIEKLYHSGADINIQNDQGETSLIVALYMNHTECATKLMELGADLKIISNNGLNAFNTAMLRRTMDLIDLNQYDKSYIRRKAKIASSMSLDGLTEELLNFIDDDSHDLPELNLDSYPKINLFLRICDLICNDDLKELELLLNNNPNLLSKISDCRDIYKFLLENSDNKGSVDSDLVKDLAGQLSVISPFINSIAVGDEEILELLFKSGLSTNFSDPYLRNPLLNACINGNTKLLKLVLELSEEGDEILNKLPQALNFAIDGKKTQILEYFIKHHQPYVVGIIGNFIADNNLDGFKFIFDNINDSNQRNEIGNICFIEAVAKGNLDILEYLITKGIYPDGDKKELMPFLVAVENDQLKVIEILCKKFPSNVGDVSGDNKCALQLAKDYYNNNMIKIIEEYHFVTNNSPLENPRCESAIPSVSCNNSQSQ